MALIKDVDSILKDRKIKVRKLGEKFEHTRLMPDDEWYPKAVRSKIRRRFPAVSRLDRPIAAAEAGRFSSGCRNQSARYCERPEYSGRG